MNIEVSEAPIRPAHAGDAPAIGRLHAESWRATYRGMLEDAYLDGPVFAEREALWAGRLTRPDPSLIALVAEEAGLLAGFVCAFTGAHARHGTLLDNLHARPGATGKGTGSRLLGALARELATRAVDEPIHLWAFEGNRRTCEYYEKFGATAVKRAMIDMPGDARVAEWLYVWPSLEALRDGMAARGLRTGPEGA